MNEKSRMVHTAISATAIKILGSWMVQGPQVKSQVQQEILKLLEQEGVVSVAVVTEHGGAIYSNFTGTAEDAV